MWLNGKEYVNMVEQVKPLKYQGHSASDIAKQLGLAESQVKRIFREIDALEEQDKAIEFEIGGTQEEVLQRIKDDEARAALTVKKKLRRIANKIIEDEQKLSVCPQLQKLCP